MVTKHHCTTIVGRGWALRSELLTTHHPAAADRSIGRSQSQAKERYHGRPNGFATPKTMSAHRPRLAGWRSSNGMRSRPGACVNAACEPRFRPALRLEGRPHGRTGYSRARHTGPERRPGSAPFPPWPSGICADERRAMKHREMSSSESRFPRRPAHRYRHDGPQSCVAPASCGEGRADPPLRVPEAGVCGTPPQTISLTLGDRGVRNRARRPCGL